MAPLRCIFGLQHRLDRAGNTGPVISRTVSGRNRGAKALAAFRFEAMAPATEPKFCGAPDIVIEGRHVVRKDIAILST